MAREAVPPLMVGQPTSIDVNASPVLLEHPFDHYQRAVRPRDGNDARAAQTPAATGMEATATTSGPAAAPAEAAAPTQLLPWICHRLRHCRTFFLASGHWVDEFDSDGAA